MRRKAQLRLCNNKRPFEVVIFGDDLEPAADVALAFVVLLRYCWHSFQEVLASSGFQLIASAQTQLPANLLQGFQIEL